MICSFGLGLQQKCWVNLIYDNVFNTVCIARSHLIACKNEILFRRIAFNAIWRVCQKLYMKTPYIVRNNLIPRFDYGRIRYN